MPSATDATCVVCGRYGPGIAASALRVDEGEWVQRGKNGVVAFRSGPSCQDRQACRARVEAGGKRWPLIDPPDGRTASTVEPIATDPLASFGEDDDPLASAFG